MLYNHVLPVHDHVNVVRTSEVVKKKNGMKVQRRTAQYDNSTDFACVLYCTVLYLVPAIDSVLYKY